jgi:hypothetical protein
MTVFEKLKLQEAYQKVLNESWGDIINAGLRTMANGSPMVIAPFENGTNKIKSAEELQREQKNNVIAGAAGLAAGAAAVNPAAAATVGKYALQGLNAYSNYELLKDLSNDLPTATTAAGAMAILKPQKAANIAQKVLNSRWGWIPGVAYPVTRAFVDGYYNGDDSQPNANQQPTSKTNQQPAATDEYEKRLAELDNTVQRADALRYPISQGGTNNLVQATGASYKNKDGLRYRKYGNKYPSIVNLVNKQLERDMKSAYDNGDLSAYDLYQQFDK